jgi:hypothetical protein
MTFKWPAVLVLALTGCTSPLAPADAKEVRGIRFEVAQSQYAPGDFVQYRLINRSAETYTYNFCGAVLTRADGNRWVVAASAASCTLVGFGLPAGETVTSGEPLPTNLPAGWYRFSMTATGGNTTCPVGGCPPEYLHTETFRIDPQP